MAATEIFDARAKTEAAEAEYLPFPFTGMDGGRYELPNVMLLESGVAKRMNDAMVAGEENKVWALFEAEFPPETVAAMDALPAIVLGQLLDAWKGTVDEEGKDPSPSSGPNRAARRSKQTSRSGAKTSGPSRSAKSKAASGSSSKTRRAS